VIRGSPNRGRVVTTDSAASGIEARAQRRGYALAAGVLVIMMLGGVPS
jgi:hypothetical protein